MTVRHGDAALLMSLPVFAWLFYWSAFWHHLWGGSRKRWCIPKLQQKTSLSVSLSPSVIWALIYMLLWQRLTSFLTGSAHAGTPGEKTKARVYRADEHHEGVACVRHSSPLPSSASPELQIFRPIAASLLPSTAPPPSRESRLWWQGQAKLCLSAGDRRAHPFCLCKCVHASTRVPGARERTVFTLMAKYNQ